MKGSDKDGSAARKRLDLGLQAIVTAEVSEQPAPVAPVLPTRQEARADDWRSLIEGRMARGEWGSVSQLCESVLDKDAENVTATIWWVRSQIELGSMPVSLLIGPLESAVAKIERGAEAKDLSSSAEELLRTLAGRTADSQIAAALLERAAKLRGSADDPAGQPAKDESASLQNDALGSVPRAVSRPGGGSHRVVVFAVGLVLLAGAGFWTMHLRAGSGTALGGGDLSEAMRVHSLDVSLATPDLQRVSPLRGLEALMYDIEAKERRPEPLVAVEPVLAVVSDKPVAQEGRQPQDTTAVAAGTATGPVARTEASASVVPARSNQVSTTGPIEPPIFDEIRKERDLALAREADTGQILFGEPKPEFPRSVPVLRPARRPPGSEPRAPSGPAPEPRGTMAATMVRTRLMARPSFRTKLVRDLPRGTRVELLGRAGDFYRVQVVPGGETGFVLAQDIAQ